MAETLELKIKSDADQAAKSIDNLGNKLRSLGGTLSSISGSNIGNFSSSLNELATSIKGLGNIDTRTFSKVAQNIQKISNVDSAKLVNSATALGDMSKQLSSFASLAKQSQDITTLIQSISKLGGKSATNAASNIRQLGSALKDVMTTLSKAPKISQNVIQMTNALANLASQGSKVGSASRSLTTGFTSITKSAKSTSGGFKGLASAFGKFYATYWMLIRAFGKIGDAVDLSSQLTEVQNVVDTTFGDMTYKVDEFTQRSIQDFGMSELTAKQIASRYQAMGTAVGITSSQVASGTDLINKKLAEQEDTLYATSDSLADMSLNLTRLAADMASFYDVDQEDVAKSLQSIFTGTTAPLRRYGIDLTQATLKEWANKQGIDANIKSMTQAEKVLLRYQYVMSQTAAAQGDFAKTADTWANSVRTLKQEFEAWGSIIGSTIINAFKPVVKFLNQVMLKVINFTRTVADALGAIFGWTIEISGAGIADDTEDVAGSVGDIGSSADSANASAKKLKKTLLSIDEIHALDSNDSSSGSGSGSGSGASGGGADTSLKKVDGLVEKYKSSIKDLYELGSYIGETITDSLNSIDWDSVYQGAKGFGKGLADFLNGLISPELFGALGKTIAGSLNTALYSLNSFGTTFDWADFGLSIASGINGFFETFDFKNLAQTINVWVQGIYSTLVEAIKNIDWQTIWKDVKDFVSNLDIETVEIVIGALAIKKVGQIIFGGTVAGLIEQSIVKALGATSGTSLGMALLGWIKRGVASIAANVGLVVEGLFSGLSFGDSIVMGFGKIAPTIVAISSVISGVVLSVVNFVKMLQDGFSALNEILMVVGVALTTVGAIIMGVAAAPAALVGAVVAAAATVVVLVHDNWDSIVEIWSQVSGWFDENVIAPVTGFFKGLWEKISGFFKNLWDDISEVWGAVSGWFSENVVEPIVGFFEGFFLRVSQVFEGLWIIIQAIWIVVSGWFNENVITPVVGFFKQLWEKVSGFFKNLWSDICTIWNIVAGWFNQHVTQPIIGFFKNVWEKVSGFFKTLWQNIKDIWNGVSSWFKTYVTDPLTKTFDGLWKGIKSGMTSAMNAVIGGIESAINFIVGGINKIIGGFNKVVSWAAKVAEVDWGGVDLVPRVSLSRIATYSTGGFPDGEDGLFFANRTELVGKFSNGKTVVANNEQITEGIRRAVVDGMMEVMMASGNGNGNNAPVIENVFKVDSETLYTMTQKGKQIHEQRFNVVTEF